MGEGRRERSSKRRKSLFRSTQKASSDSEIAGTKRKDRKVKARDDLPWPKTIEVLTVDELARYRRRRIRNYSENTLGICHSSKDDSLERLVTEYRRAFRATSEASFIRKNHNTDRLSKRIDNYNDHVGSMDTDAQVTNIPGRLPLIRRGTSLKGGGDTEYSNYGTYESARRPELARRPTSLRMEGDMQTVTEQCEKFIEWFNVTRPGLARVPTHLKLEGQQETSTESHDKYIPFVGARRPEILRQNAHLRLEGETRFLPEYTDVFRQPITQEKRLPMLPQSHLKAGGEFFEKTEQSQQFLDPRGSVLPYIETFQPPLQINEDSGSSEQAQGIIDALVENEDDDMKGLLSKVEDIKAPPLETPEYKDAYRDFPRERPKLMKPEDEIGRADGSKIQQSSNSEHFHIKIDQDPEYKSKYLEKERQVYRKGPMSLRGPMGHSNFEKHIVSDLRSQPSTSEVRSQYVPYGNVPRVESLRMPQNLRSEGPMDLRPEYREAYCGRIIKGHDNNWINNNNTTYEGDDQDAFQVLETRVDDNIVSGKPPVVARRASRLSQIQRPINFDTANPSQHIRHQSPSPTYRLQPRRSSSLHPTQMNPTPEDILSSDNHRSYEPSFGKELQQNPGQHAFVVLDNVNTTSEQPRRRRFDPNSNCKELRGNIVAQKKSPPNWMPPWYDNTTPI